MSNFQFLKGIDSDLYSIVKDAEKLYRDEYFEQCCIQTRRYAENVCKKLLEDTAVCESSFDEMLSYLSDRVRDNPANKEFVEDLYFLKKAGNQSAHGTKVKNDGAVALECLQRSFEVGINYMLSRGISPEKVKNLHYDIDLLMTGEKSEKTFSEKYIELKEQEPEINEDNLISVKNLKKTKKNHSQNQPKTQFQFGIVKSIFWGLFILCLAMIAGFIFL